MKNAFRIVDDSSYGEKKATLHYLEAPDQEGQYALLLLSQFGLVMSEDNGEDSTGRQKGRLLPVTATVGRAFDLAHEAFIQLRGRNLLITYPDPNILNAEHDLKRARRLEAKEPT
jgi:hypothetical protein